MRRFRMGGVVGRSTGEEEVDEHESEEHPEAGERMSAESCLPVATSGSEDRSVTEAASAGKCTVSEGGLSLSDPAYVCAMSCRASFTGADGA